jgi:hypothetical protein
MNGACTTKSPRILNWFPRATNYRLATQTSTGRCRSKQTQIREK